MKLKHFLLIPFFFAAIPASVVTGQWVKTNGYGGTCLFCNDNNIFCGTDNGLYRSTDYGSSWTECGLERESVSALESNTQFLFAANSNGNPMCRSTNNGTTWTIIDSGLENLRLFSLAVNNGYLFASTENNLVRSTDNGTSWTQLKTPPCGCFASEGQYLFAGMGSGVIRSSDEWDNWISVSKGLPNAGFGTIAASAGNLFVGYGHYGGSIYSITGVFRSTDSGESWALSGLNNSSVFRLLAVGGGNLFAVVWDARGDGPIYLSTDNGTNWNAVDSGLTTQDNPADLAVDGNYLYFATEGEVWKRSLSEMIAPSPVIQGIEVYPNPASSTVNISFAANDSVHAKISIYNVLGSEVARLFDGTLPSGNQTYTWNSSEVALGTYYCVVLIGSQTTCAPVLVYH